MRQVWGMALGAMMMLGPVMARGAEMPTNADLKAWGVETLSKIESTFKLPSRGLYAEEATPGKAPSNPSFMWAAGVQLAALAGAARADRPAYGLPLRRFVEALQVYWAEGNGVGGYDVLPHPKGLDRYYDDNEWIVLALEDAYEATHDRWYLDKAEAAHRFVMSGHDDKLGGGIYWHEQGKDSKNTCSNAPAVCELVRLAELTGKREYLEQGTALYDWTKSHLQDTDGLYFDAEALDGKIGRAKWSYNTALMIRANVLLWRATKEAKYLAEAQRVAAAAEAKWVKPETGALADEAHFAHLLSEAFLYLFEADHNARWRNDAFGGMGYLHAHGRDARGYYGPRWDTTPKEQDKVRLIDQASAARAYWVGSRMAAKDGDLAANERK